MQLFATLVSAAAAASLRARDTSLAHAQALSQEHAATGWGLCSQICHLKSKPERCTCKNADTDGNWKCSSYKMTPKFMSGCE